MSKRSGEPARLLALVSFATLSPCCCSAVLASAEPPSQPDQAMVDAMVMTRMLLSSSALQMPVVQLPPVTPHTGGMYV